MTPLPEPQLLVEIHYPQRKEPVPAVVLIHDCDDPVTHFQSWASRLQRWGYASLRLDRCQGLMATNSPLLSSADLQQALVGAITVLRRDPRILPGRIGVMGWSLGGSIALNAVNRFGLSATTGLRPRAVVAFYPLCQRVQSPQAAPALILVGDQDEYAPPRLCQRLGRANLGLAPEVQVLPGAFHAFDSPAVTTPGAADGLVRRYSQAAFERALIDVQQFLALHLAITGKRHHGDFFPPSPFSLSPRRKSPRTSPAPR